MRAVLVSNITHYHHLAAGLAGAGYLARYITTLCPYQEDAIPGWLSGYWQRKLEGRRLTHIPRERVRQVWAAEGVQRLLPATRLVSRDRGDWANNYLFDWLAKRHIPECDVLHFVSSVGLACALQAKRRGATTVCDVRQEHPFFQKRLLEEESARYGLPLNVSGASYQSKVLDELAVADYIIAPSEHAKRTYVAEGFARDQVLPLPFGVDLEQFQPAAGGPSQKFQILYAGAITLRKGPQYLLEAFRQARLREASLTLVGPLDPAFQPILARYEGICRVLPPLPKSDLARLYAESSVFVLPSLADSFSLATLEAMACGIPVIVSENTGAADLVSNGRNGYVVPIRDATALTERLTELYSDRERCLAMGRDARQAACRMTWERYARSAVALYQFQFQKDAA